MNKSQVKQLRQTTAVKYGMDIPSQKKGETDYAYYKRLAKMADQRLVRLEKYAEDSQYKGAKQYAYAKAQHDIEAFGGTSRFNIVPSRKKDGTYNQNELNQQMAAVKRFLASPTSTKKGITSIYKERTNTINQKYGTNFTWQELAKFYDRGMADKLANKVAGSDTMMIALGHIKRIGDNPEAIKEVIDGVKMVSKDEVVNEVTISLLEQGYTAEDLFK